MIDLRAADQRDPAIRNLAGCAQAEFSLLATKGQTAQTANRRVDIATL